MSDNSTLSPNQSNRQDRILNYFFVALSGILFFAASGLTLGLFFDKSNETSRFTTMDWCFAAASLVLMYLVSLTGFVSFAKTPRMKKIGEGITRVSIYSFWIFIVAIGAKDLIWRAAGPSPRGSSTLYVLWIMLPLLGLYRYIDNRIIKPQPPGPDSSPSASPAPAKSHYPLIETIIITLLYPITLLMRGTLLQLFVMLFVVLIPLSLIYAGERISAGSGQPVLGAAIVAVLLLLLPASHLYQKWRGKRLTPHA